MNDAEVVQKVVAILTETAALVREEGPGEDDAGARLIGDLVKELTSIEVTVASDSSPQEVVAAVSAALVPTIGRAFGAFSSAFHLLAQEHDRTDPEVTSDQILRDLALRAENGKD